LSNTPEERRKPEVSIRCSVVVNLVLTLKTFKIRFYSSYATAKWIKIVMLADVITKVCCYKCMIRIKFSGIYNVTTNTASKVTCHLRSVGEYLVDISMIYYQTLARDRSRIDCFALSASSHNLHTDMWTATTTFFSFMRNQQQSLHSPSYNVRPVTYVFTSNRDLDPNRLFWVWFLLFISATSGFI
jgi:hypothetical protein